MKWLLGGGLAVVVAVAVASAGFVYAMPDRAARLAIGTERKLAGLVRKEIDLPGGLHSVYLEGGQGEPLILLHGFGANKDNFLRVARQLTPHYRVIVPDLTGFGESSRPDGADYMPAAQAERVRALAQALGLRRLHLGGSSMGGQIAMSYAVLHPDEVASLWLLDPAGVWSAPRSELGDIYVSTGRNPLVAHNEAEFAETFAFVMSDPPFVPGPIVKAMAREPIRNAPLAEKIFKQFTADSLEGRVKGLATPTLIVWGEQDRVIHVGTGAVLRQLLPRSQLIVMPGVGHLPMIERPRQTADDYLRFRAAL
ncbi:alpha/beta hydrolase [Janthinobacterium sp. BJB412]|nr:alpha/beta hydrolase [Janthinobacterium sp. BJB412]